MNRLIHEKSTYLLQHATNPIDWYAWGDEAIERAKTENKMIFLSIGYSTCHWCHVMEKESFADDEVASYLNRHFVSIKVDREERPDLDHIYMSACQLLSGQGGWPLNLVLTPNLEPIFAGTYFPKRRKFGRPGLLDVLTQLFVKWFENRERVLETASQIVEAIKQKMHFEAKDPDETILEDATISFQKRFDPTHGGFGNAPKFPIAVHYLFLMRDYMRTKEESTLEMVEISLNHMGRGGIYDHLGGGFARYSTDAKWLVPHFEKMLSDNALLLLVYTEAYQLTRNAFYRTVVEGIISYVERDMRSEDGLWYSAEDADTDGVEGAFYLWTKQEVEELFRNDSINALQESGMHELGPAELLCHYFGIHEQGHLDGKCVLNRLGDDTDTFVANTKIPQVWLNRLFEHRNQRTKPQKDQKLLTAWNALMIVALAKAGTVFERKEWVERAQQAIIHLRRLLRRADGRWLIRYCDGEAAHDACLVDYAYLLWAELSLIDAGGKSEHLKHAIEIAEQIEQLFWDEVEGGCWFTARDRNVPVTTWKDHFDGVLPSGNGLCAWLFLRLSQLTQQSKWSEKSEMILAMLAHVAEESPTTHAMYLIALDWKQQLPQDLVIVGLDEDPQLDHWAQQIQQLYLPFLNLIVVRESDRNQWERYTSLIKGKDAMYGNLTAYLCEEGMCLAPYTQLNDLLRRLNVES